MPVVWLVVAGVALSHLWIGYRRAAARSFTMLGTGIAIHLSAALVCYLIGEGKTGGYLAGIVGFVMMLLLLISSGAMALAGATRFGLDLAQRTPRVSTAIGMWDMLLLSVLALAAICLSAVE